MFGMRKTSLSILAIVVLTGFASLAVFGFMTMMAHGNHTDCAAATAQGGACPEGETALAYVSFHLDALRSFTSATFGSPFLIALALILVTFGIATGILSTSLPPISSRTVNRFEDFLRPPVLTRLTAWTALHEASPTFSG